MEALGLPSERVSLKDSRSATADRLRINGATREEIAFLIAGQRVELNALSSDRFIAFVERSSRRTASPR